MTPVDEDIREILRLLDGSPYDELNLRTDHFELVLRRSHPNGGWTQQTRTLDKPNLVPGRPTGEGGNAVAEASERIETSPKPSGEGVADIEAPLIGTFYRAPKPGSDPFVEVGDSVNRDTVVGIIEVMKLMNSVAAGTAGEIIEICAYDGEFIEQGRVLMRVRVSGT